MSDDQDNHVSKGPGEDRHAQWEPLEQDEHQRQVSGLLNLASTLRQRVRGQVRILDLGCGNGRTLIPLCREGHVCVGLDRDPESTGAVERRCRIEGLTPGQTPTFIEHDFLALPWPVTDRPFHMVTCLGRTFMQVHETNEAIALVRQIAGVMAGGLEPGLFVIDNIPGELWPLVTDGSWCTGVAEDGSSQMVWDACDNVFAIRYGPAIRPESDHPDAQDIVRYRLWTMGELRLLAAVCGLRAPVVDVQAGLIWFERSA